MSLYIWPPVSLASTPLRFLLDSISTEVNRDTVTPANSKPLPIIQLDDLGNVVSSGLSMVDTGILLDTITLGGVNTDVKTFTVAIKKMRFVYNGGEELIIAVNGTDVGYLGLGDSATIDFSLSIGDILQLRTVSGAASAAGKLYLTFFA